MYFCQGADFNNFDVSSNEHVQGLPGGYVYSIGPVSPANMNFQINLDFKIENADETTVEVMGYLYGRFENDNWH